MPPITNRRNSPRKKSHTKSQSQSKKTNQRGLVRIIAGFHRGRRLPVIVSDGLRPTSDRVKETLFNWLMNKTAQSVCLDLFAGSGGLGIEALSRGASKVYFIERDKTVAATIQKNLETLKETEKSAVLVNDALTLEYDELPKFDLVFIDPPFGKNLVSQSIDKLIQHSQLAENAMIYVEVGHDDSFTAPSQFKMVKEIKTSQVSAFLYEFSH